MTTTISDLPKIISDNGNITPNIIFEIGASTGYDSYFLQTEFNIDSKNVFCFEPNVANYKELTSLYPNYNSYNVAVSDFNGESKFYMHIPANDVSSFKKIIDTVGYWNAGDENYREEMVDVIRMDEFIEKNNIEHIDICKIDVEGNAFEVLVGFGEKLKIVKSIHIESEIKPVFGHDQKLFKDVEELLKQNGFTMVDYQEHIPFRVEKLICDSVWIKNEFLW